MKALAALCAGLLAAAALASGADAQRISPPAAAGIRAQGNVSNPTGTASTTAVMMGWGVTFTPTVTGKVLIHIQGDVANNTAGDGISVALRYGTGAAPTNGAAFTGTQCGNVVTSNKGNASQQSPLAMDCYAALNAGTTYWLDTSASAVTGGTANEFDLSYTIVEE